jgi:hypothetical protein
VRAGVAYSSQNHSASNERTAKKYFMNNEEEPILSKWDNYVTSLTNLSMIKSDPWQVFHSNSE